MLGALPFFLILGIPLALLPAARNGGLRTLVFFFWPSVVVPLLDQVITRSTRDPTEKEIQSRSRAVLHDLPLYLWVPVQLALLGWGVWWIGDTTLSWSEILLVTASLGAATEIGVIAAHELMHRSGRLPRAAAEVLMACAT